MFSFLQKQYPYRKFSKQDLVTDGLIGCFVAIFLLLFQPFNISIWQTNYKVFKICGFGLVSFICPLLFRIIFHYSFNSSKQEEKWVVWKEITALLMVIILITIGNLCYSNSISISNFSIKNLLFTFLGTVLIAIFPIFANVFLKYNRFLTLNIKEAQIIEQEISKYSEPQLNTEVEKEKTADQLVFIAENLKDTLTLHPHQLLYIESTNNYSSIIYMVNGKQKKELIRSSLKRLETQITEPTILRCHRAYIANLKNVAHITGNAQGYRISFEGINNTIPVSRNYGKHFLEQLKK